MEPVLISGAEVLLICGQGGAPGDVVAYRVGERVVVHRVVARAGGGGWIVTRGDARWLPDVPIAGPEAILGRITGRRGADGYEALPHPTSSVVRSAALWPLVALLRVSPRAGTGLIRGLVTARRSLLRVAAGLRARSF